MRVIIAGGRDFDDFDLLERTMEFIDVSAVVCGEARGADRLGKQWAQKYAIPVDSYRPDWDLFGKSAGYRRNVDMADNADMLVAFWDGESKGTKHMIDIATRKGLKVEVIRYD